jgi:hypothetical protein
VETSSTIDREVWAHRGDFVDAFRDGPRHDMGPMPQIWPEREAMCKIPTLLMEKRHFRSDCVTR